MFETNIPAHSGNIVAVNFEPGRLTFVMGANGTGKSSLMDLIARSHRAHVSRIYAHRNVTLDSSSVSFTGADRNSYEQSMRGFFAQANSRFQNPYGSQTVNSVLYDIHAAETAFSIAQLKELKAANPRDPAGLSIWDRAQNEFSPFQRLEQILHGAGLRLSLRVDERGTIKAARDSHEPYGVNELSDGERSAFLLAATVVTAPRAALILIDEPERHLHRSISSPLIHALLADRQDCSFVISTHDIGLSLDQPACSAILLREYRHHPQSWHLDYIAKVESLDEEVAEAVLGSRQTIIFVEGVRTSLDHALYSHLFPGTSVRAAGSCSDVINATRGVNETTRDHRVQAVGVIDRDRRSEENVTSLSRYGVIALGVHAIESLYYHPNVVRLVARRLEKAGLVMFEAVDAALDKAILEAFQAARETVVQDAAARHVRNAVLSNLPKADNLKEGSFPPAGLAAEEVERIYQEERARFDELIGAGDAHGLCASYPIKRTGLIRAVYTLLRLQDGAAYADILRKMAVEDNAVADELRQIVGPLTAYLEALKGKRSG
ncbi:ATP-binding cassette domain-containing protein [Sinorhizobium meliloti]|uniref:AAA family ATPase n=1 Tax=Rhizobium meliloti TaxID=382 RepID=UPI000FD2A9DC|nr:AAA family ATPase [Sinorhizobium meliloti]RVI19988.1 ATP-binding cassette domain-containing protein [Sinorhizobium meliloti]RVN91514.1 ATP-binding cassette domain-containing protein [Sinorhizobium meliloti]RVO15027.1 ATP-binding cassette domain-containing protein [Sinorhizobium meliloti]